MLKVINMPTVSAKAIRDEFGIEIFDCEFTQTVVNDSYVRFYLNDDQVEELTEEIEHNKNSFEDSYVTRLETELKLVNSFRALGYTDSILIDVSW